MWIAWALACAFFHSSSDALSKRLLVRSNEWVVAWAVLLFTLPWLVLWASLSPWPVIQPGFWGLVVVMIPLELLAYLCYLRALRISPLSLVIPFQAFTPLLTVATGFLFLGEHVATLGFVGVLGVTVGAYVLQAELVPQGILEPIKAIGRVPGIRYMLITAACYSVTAALGKKAVLLSNPAAFALIYFSIETVVLTPLAFWGARSSGGLVRGSKKQWKMFALTGVVIGGIFVTHFIGVMMAPVAYFLALKRLSLLVSVLYGGLLFREAALLQRLAGAGLMLLGAILVTLSA